MENIVINLRQIIQAMDTLEVKGYTQCKTYTNIMEALQITLNMADEKFKEEGVSKAITEVDDEGNPKE